MVNYEDRISKYKISSQIKAKAVLTNGKPRTIIKDIFGHVNIKDASTLPPMHNFKQQIDRRRKKETDFCKEVKTLKELVIQEKNKLTKSGKDFILFDSGYEDEERIIILSTRENIEFLNSESVWYVDGTFEISPDIFKQLFTINVIKNNRNLPLVYCFLSNKLQKT